MGVRDVERSHFGTNFAITAVNVNKVCTLEFLIDT